MPTWLPWKFVLRYVAQKHRFVDPINLLAYLHRFAQPSEVAEPIELLRAGVIFHARGLINSKAIQHNLDWIWPHWVVRQFNPRDKAFIPRAFSITHINLTHRNWTAVGLPDLDLYPLVDPRGMTTPLEDGWSLDGWVLTDDGRRLFPSRLDEVEQQLLYEENLVVETRAAHDGLELVSRVRLEPMDDTPHCRLRLEACADAPGWLVLALRPLNPEGISFIHKIELATDRAGWIVNGKDRVGFGMKPDRHRFSQYHDGDVSFGLPEDDGQTSVDCHVGMATAAALFRLEAGRPRELTANVTLLRDHRQPAHVAPRPARESWGDAMAEACRLELPDPQIQFLYDTAVRTLVLLSPDDVYPGPYTYKRFWFRDAVLMLNAMGAAGLLGRVERTLGQFPTRQTNAGFFHSQEGEWDSNGQSLWMFKRWSDLSGKPLPKEWRASIYAGARWIQRKRVSPELDKPHAGLLPAGFSAEHLGPNDFYYWDDFWAVGGLRAAADLVEAGGDQMDAAELRREAESMMASIERSLTHGAARRGRPALPASPYRRLDAGAIGSLVVGYPLMLWPADDPRLLDTVEYLLEACFLESAFFQDMIHSGFNAYLTLHVAQVLLRAGDPRWLGLIRAVADLASPTGQWPEAIHPHTRGGCMGDGQHGWAAAEWVMMIRNCFVLEEEAEGVLVLGAGVAPEWLAAGRPIRFGAAPTTWGPVSLEILPEPGAVRVRWQGRWHGPAPRIRLRLPGLAQLEFSDDTGEATLKTTP